jgi:manganese/zinc/iron transport system ATP- binding protein
MNNTNNILNVSRLSAEYEKKTVLDALSFCLPSGIRCAIVGPNGAGKTTLIRALLGLHPLKEGTILFWNTSYKNVREKIAYVPQRKNVDWSFPITVYDTIAMGTFEVKNFFGFSLSKEKKYQIDLAIEKMGISAVKNNHINDLSGGQQQRVFIARALVQNADLFILDEPLTGLDNSSEKTIVSTFFDLQQSGKTILAVHHDWNTLTTYFDWIIFINKKIFYYGPVASVDIKNLLSTPW